MTADRDRTGDAPIEQEQKDEGAPVPPAPPETVDPSDEVPVPVAMSAAEIDERAQVVEALRREREPDAGNPEDDAVREP